MGRMDAPKTDEGVGLNHQTSACQSTHLTGFLKRRSDFDHACHSQAMNCTSLERKGVKRDKAETAMRGA